MKFALHSRLRPWLVAAMAGVVAPTIAILLFMDASPLAPAPVIAGPVMAIGLMSVGMIAAAVAGRLRVGVLLALLTGAGLFLLAGALGAAPMIAPLSAGFALVIASFSFAARGALFARSGGERGWWIAVAVVCGEAAVLATAALSPDSLPGWLLALLPAQWASTAFETTLSGSGPRAASAELFALAGTALATLLVVRLWPRRWPYLIMFTAWLGLSALVWHSA